MKFNDEIREFGEGLKNRQDPSLVDLPLIILGFQRIYWRSKRYVIMLLIQE